MPLPAGSTLSAGLPTMEVPAQEILHHSNPAPVISIDSRVSERPFIGTHPDSGVYTYSQLLGAKAEPLRFVLEGLMVEGQVTFLAGPYAIGKTMLSLQFSQHLAMGRAFMGRRARRPYKVAFIDTENGLTEMTSRLQSQSAALSLTDAEAALLRENWLYIDTDIPGPLQYLKLDKAGFVKLRKFVQDNQIEALIFDNFGRLFPGKETDDERLKEFFNELKRLRNDCPTLQNGLLLFLHHVTKPSFDAGAPSLLTDPYLWLSRVRGSGRILDFSQVRLGFDEQEDSEGGKYHVLNGILRSQQASPLLLERGSDGRTFALHADKQLVIRNLFKRAKKQKELYEQMPLDRDITFTECKRLGYHTNTVNDALAVCCANGLVRKNQDGSYRRLPQG